MGAGAITVGVVAEELGRADMSCAIPTFFLVRAGWGYILSKYGRNANKEAILPKVTKGRAFLGIAATEPDVGSDLANMKTVAGKSGGDYVVNGEKTFISGIDEIRNQLGDGGGYLTLVRTDTGRGTRGMSLLYIPIKEVRGVTTTILEEWGRRGISTGGFALEEVEVPEAYLLGEENRGFYLAYR
jgi:acyl-CoA dehydrogenase